MVSSRSVLYCAGVSEHGEAFRVLDLGLSEFSDSWQLQKELVAARQNGDIEDTLVLTEHPHVVTLGRGSHTENLLNLAGIPVFEIERGGDVTYHGPGQLVGYPIFLLRDSERDLHRYLRNVEQVIINTCEHFDIPAGRKAEYTGAWTQGPQQKKLASIGIACKRWVTLHGFALNVTTDLARFSVINPCGLDAQVMTSMASELPTAPPMSDVKAEVIRQTAHVFERRLVS